MKNFKIANQKYIVRIGKNGKYSKVVFETSHEAKSHAGKIFHDNKVDSVAVFDAWQKILLVLEKTSHGVIRQESETIA